MTEVWTWTFYVQCSRGLVITILRIIVNRRRRKLELLIDSVCELPAYECFKFDKNSILVCMNDCYWLRVCKKYFRILLYYDVCFSSFSWMVKIKSIKENKKNKPIFVESYKYWKGAHIYEIYTTITLNLLELLTNKLQEETCLKRQIF